MTTEFICWTGQDEEGKFKHVGQLIKQTSDEITMVVDSGSTMTFPVDDGEIKTVAKPKNWTLAKPAKEKEQPTPIKKTTTTRVKKSTSGESKKDKAVAIYKEMMDNGEHPARKDVIAKFMSDLEMTQAGASTYQNMCKKAV